MKLLTHRPRIRFSLRTLFIVVTVSSVACWLWSRSIEFERLATEHDQQRDWSHLGNGHIITGHNYDPRYCSEPGMLNYHYKNLLAIHHSELSAKYRRASRYPWLPVDPDPPEPTE